MNAGIRNSLIPTGILWNFCVLNGVLNKGAKKAWLHLHHDRPQSWSHYCGKQCSAEHEYHMGVARTSLSGLKRNCQLKKKCPGWSSILACRYRDSRLPVCLGRVMHILVEQYNAFVSIHFGFRSCRKQIKISSQRREATKAQNYACWWQWHHAQILPHEFSLYHKKCRIVRQKVYLVCGLKYSRGRSNSPQEAAGGNGIMHK